MPKVDDMSGDVPIAAQSDIRALKGAMVAAADTQLGCGLAEATRVPDLRNALLAALGTNVYVNVRRAPGKPPWLLVRIGFPVGGCSADDNILLVYAWGDARWRRILRWQSGDYSTILGAWGDFFDYAVLPENHDHGRRIVVAHGLPWCTSIWSGFDADVVEPGPDPNSARQVFNLKHGYYRDASQTLRPAKGGFELQLMQCVRGNPAMCYMGVFHYSEQQGRYERVRPMAIDPKGFVGAWLNAGWPRAAAWSLSSQKLALEETHADTSLYSMATAGYPSFGDTLACTGSRYQVELKTESQHPAALRYFIVRADGNNDFTMLSSSVKPDPECDRAVVTQSQ